MPGCSIFPSTSPFAWRATGSLSRSISKTLRPPSRSPGRVNTGLWDQRSSTPIETAGGLPPCSVTQHPNSLGWARPARARVAMRSDFWLALALKFQICLVSTSILEMLSHPQKMLSKSDDLILLIVPVDHRDLH